MITKYQAKKIIEILAQRNRSTGYFDSHDFIDPEFKQTMQQCRIHC